MLDDLRQIQEIDKSSSLHFAAKQPDQLRYTFTPVTLSAAVDTVVFCGMGGSALAAELLLSWSQVEAPFIINRDYKIPKWVNTRTLVVIASYSGNTEEAIAALTAARAASAQIVVMGHGGILLEKAEAYQLPNIRLPESTQPRTGVFYAFRALMDILVGAKLVDPAVLVTAEKAIPSLQTAITQWVETVPLSDNLAKQLAMKMLGKTVIVYGGPLTFAAAYKWKISVNENAKNTAWCNRYPEFNHNEFAGWSSHPIEKPFAVFDLLSSFEDERILQRFHLSDRLLSGKRPAAVVVMAEGASDLEQLLYLVLLGDFATTYLAILNGVDPTPIAIIERFKKELESTRLA